MLDSFINLHPYLASFVFLVLWCLIGYFEGRFISRVFACVTWSITIVASVLALTRLPGLGLVRFAVGIAIIALGTAWIAYYCKHGVSTTSDRTSSTRTSGN